MVWTMIEVIQQAYFKENDCSEGFQCINPANPEPCPPGKFNSKINSAFCDNCPFGKNCSEISETMPRICVAGYECSQPKTPRPCPPGTYQDKENSTDCIDCPKGHYCPTNGLKTGFNKFRTHCCIKFYTILYISAISYNCQ